jgi:hypothetical protein
VTKVTTSPVSAFTASETTRQRDNKTMICVPCRQRHHQDCPGGTWCDCQHLPAQDAGEDTVEPPLSWVRQG